eukprot:IDg8862t1
MGKIENSSAPKGSMSCRNGIQGYRQSNWQRNVIVALNVEGRRKMCILKDVLHFPDLGCQLLSVSTMDKLGLETSFKHPDKALVASLQRWHERLVPVGEAGMNQNDRSWGGQRSDFQLE